MTRLIFQDDLGDGLLGSMRKRESNVFYAQLQGKFRRPAVKFHSGTPTRQADNLAVAPAHAPAPARSQRFHSGFLCCEPRGVALLAVGFGIAVSSLASGKDAPQKALSKSLHRVANTRNFGDVYAATDDHVSLLGFTPTTIYRSLSPR